MLKQMLSWGMETYIDYIPYLTHMLVKDMEEEDLTFIYLIGYITFKLPEE